MREIFTALLLLLIVVPSRGSDLADDWNDLQSFLPKIQGVCTTQPSNVVTGKYTAGQLLGNGEIGVVVGDTLTSQKFYFGKSDFLGLARNDRQNRWENSILPIGSLRISSPQPSTDPESVFRMEQDITQAEVRATMRLGQTIVNMRSWTADSENLFVTELSSPVDAQPVTIDLELAENPSPLFPSTAGVSDGGVLWVTRQASSANPSVSTTNAASPGIGGGLNNVFRSRVAVAMKIIGANLEQPVAPNNAAAKAQLTLRSARPVQILVAIRSDAKFGDGLASIDSLRDSAVKRVSEIKRADVAKLLDEHHQWWKDFWLKSYVRLNDDVLEKYYYGALYVLGSSARAGHVLPSMWGMWITTDMPSWGGRHFFNYNAQAPYYGVASSNRAEMILPYAEFVTAELPYQVNKTHAAGYRGATFTRSYCPYDLFRERPPVTPVAPEKDWKRLPTDQKSNGDFGAMPLIMYWQYTRDQTFLREKLYPLLKELDLFWRDYMEKEPFPSNPRQGYRYVIRHSGAHEYSGAAAADDVNPNLDVGFFRYNTMMLIEAAKELNVDAEMIPVWEDVLGHLADFPIGKYNGKDCFETAESVRGGQGRKMEPGNQPVNMEGAVHPAELVALGGDPYWIKIGLNTLEHMQSWGLGGGSANNGFCKVWPIAARLGWPADDFVDKFKAAILHLWRESNLTCFQGGGGIETSGSIDAVNSMLLQSYFGEMRVFPVWPTNRDAYFKRLRAKGAFIVSSSFKNGKVEFVDITSEKGLPLKLINPWGDSPVQVSDSSERATVESRTAGGAITFNTVAGRSYHVAPKAP